MVLSCAVVIALAVAGSGVSPLVDLRAQVPSNGLYLPICKHTNLPQ
jgi:hypothetical protein